MKSGPKTIKDLFLGAKIFRVPEYQRPYAWEKQQFQEFLEDISHNLNRNHFFGTILFHEKPSVSETFRHIDIVDGQQRITTLVIFIKLILEKLAESDNDLYENLKKTYIQFDGECKLNVLPTDNGYFKSCILKDDPGAADYAKTPSQKRLLKAKEWFKIWLDNWFNEESFAGLQQLIFKIENMQVSTYSVEDNTEAALIFETTNDRGKPLTNLDKVKSFLMYRGSFASYSPENRESLLETLQERFGEIYRDIDEIETGIPEDSILKYHCIAFEDWTSARDYQQPIKMIKRIVNTHIEEGKNTEAIKFIKNFSLRLQKTFANIKVLLLHNEPYPYLRDMFVLKRPGVFYHLLLKTYQQDVSNNKKDFKRVTRLMEIICFRFGIEGLRVDTERARLYKWAKDFNKDFNGLIKKLKNFIDKFCDENLFHERLQSSLFNKRVKVNDQGYLFWKYENYLRREEQPIFPEMSDDDFTNKGAKTKFSIEHIIPQNPKKSKIVEEGSEDTLPIMSAKFENNYLHSIGNLTIDPFSANSSKSNHNFKYKDQNYFRKAPLKIQNELSDFINEETEKWDEVSISERSEKILEFALNYWNHENV